ncbi:MAG: hypothetical protein WDN75_14675 [Bacteroidota bacterium]
MRREPTWSTLTHLASWINPKSLNVTGRMAARGIAHQLPFDYWPIEDVEAEFARGLNKIFEKIYVHTDKP